MTAQEAFLLAIAYTKKVIEGGGALKGAACQIKSITAITGGHRITFEWEDNAGNVETDTMDVMDGTDGAAGVGISTIAYKEEDAQGNYVYTITLTSGSTYDITCPKGPQGATGATGADGADGQDGADGVGITSITKTGTSGLVDTYTITYTNGTTSTFTVTNGADLTAGQYIEIDNDTISVKRDIARDVDAIITTSFDFPNCTVTKTIDEEVADTVTFSMFDDIPSSVMDVYSVSYNPQAMVLTFTNTVASKEHVVGYTFQVASYSSGVVDTQTFVETLDADKKLIIKSELDTAINAIKDGQSIDSFADVETALGEKADTDIVASDFSTQASYTAGDYCIYEGKFYKFKANHSGAWSAADVDEIKIAGELSALKSGLTNINSEVDTIKNGIVYGFHIDGSVSDPSNRVTYLRDAIGKTPAYMDYNEGSFNYGSWEDTFFMPRPCMVERSGNVAYYLNPNDYTKKADGTASDIADTAYAGNAMMEWGRDGKKIWMKIEPDSGDTNSCNVYIADHRVDSTFHDWSFHNCNGVSVDHFYTPIYNGSAVSDGTNNVLRSLSGQYISHTQNASTEITMAGRNNAGSAEIWGTEVYADIVLINMLLTLIGKSTNTQGVFGRGLDDGGENAMKAYVTGALNDKGLFFGYNDGSHGVKVFGMENWWACQWRRYRGHIMVDGVQKVKLAYGTEDGSTAAGYNLTGDNYISVGATPTGTSGQYCDKYEFSPNGAFPKDADNTKATASTHYCDGLWFINSEARVPFRGGASDSGSPGGAWSVFLVYAASGAWWFIGAALSCKPLA